MEFREWLSFYNSELIKRYLHTEHNKESLIYIVIKERRVLEPGL